MSQGTPIGMSVCDGCGMPTQIKLGKSKRAYYGCQCGRQVRYNLNETKEIIRNFDNGNTEEAPQVDIEEQDDTRDPVADAPRDIEPRADTGKPGRKPRGDLDVARTFLKREFGF